MLGINDEHFSRQYGFWRPYVGQVIYRYLDCGEPHNGFARVRCFFPIIRALFSQERMQYLDQEGKVAKDGKTNKSFQALGWQARSRPPPKIHDPPIRENATCDLHLQTHNDDHYGDPEYSWDQYI